MRRSAAPSQVLGNVAKKPRFIPPGKSITVPLKNKTKEMDQEMKLKEIDEKERSASLLSKIYGQNENANFTQSVESTGKVKTIKACFGINKCSKMEMKTLNTPKAALGLPGISEGHHLLLGALPWDVRGCLLLCCWPKTLPSISASDYAYSRVPLGWGHALFTVMHGDGMTAKQGTAF